MSSAASLSNEDRNEVNSGPSLEVHKPRRACRKDVTAVIIFTILLLLCATGALLAWTTNFVDEIIVQNMILKNGTVSYKWFNHPPIHPILNIYIFNYTNVEAFESGEERLRVEELGPYTYIETLENTNIHHDDENTITFQERRIFTFVPELSRGAPTDLITVPNLVLLGFISLIRDSYYLVKVKISSILESLNVKLFIKLSVNDFLWGYEDILVTAAKIIPFKYQVPVEKAGVLVGRNGTSRDKITIFTGEHSIRKLGSVQKFNGRTHLTNWGSEECNSVGGNTGMFFPPFISKNEKLQIYFKELCRKFPIIFREELEVNGIPGFRFTALKNVFDDAERNPENACYCPEGPPCMPSGLFNASTCAFGAPVAASFPHFYLGDMSHINTVDGLEANKSKHELYIDIQNKFGIPLQAKLRIQLNIIARKVEGFNQMKMFSSDMVLPLVWMEESIDHLPDEVLDTLRAALKISRISVNGLTCGLLGMACVCFVTLMCFVVMYLRKQRGSC